MFISFPLFSFASLKIYILNSILQSNSNGLLERCADDVDDVDDGVMSKKKE